MRVKVLLCTCVLCPTDARLQGGPWEDTVLNLGLLAPVDVRTVLLHAAHVTDPQLEWLTLMLQTLQLILGRHFTGQMCKSLGQALSSDLTEVNGALLVDQEVAVSLLQQLQKPQLQDLAQRACGTDKLEMAAEWQLLMQALPPLGGDVPRLLFRLFVHLLCQRTPNAQSYHIVSFDQFALCAPVSQVLTPRDLLLTWLQLCEFPEEDAKALTMCVPETSGLSLIELLQHSQRNPRRMSYVTRCTVRRLELACDYLQPFAARAEQLPWNDLPRIFREHPPSFSGFLQLLMSSAQPLWLLASTPPQTLDMILQSASDSDLECLAMLLTPGEDGSPQKLAVTAAPHLELLEWLLAGHAKLECTHNGLAALAIAHFHICKVQAAVARQRCRHLPLRGIHIELMLDAGLQIRLSPNIAPQLMRLLVVLDSPPMLLVDQAELSNWLSTGCRLSDLKELLFRDVGCWGRVLLEAMLHSSVRAAVPASVLSQTPLAKLVYLLVSDGSKNEIAAARRAIKGPDTVATPSAAFAAALLRRLSVGALPVACEALVDLVQHRQLGDFVRACVPPLSPDATFELMSAARDAVPELTLALDAFDGNTTNTILWLILTSQHEELAQYVHTWAAWPASDARDTQESLPLEKRGMEQLREALVHVLSAKIASVAADDAASADAVYRLLKGNIQRLHRSAQASLLEHLCRTGGPPESPARQRLALILWACNPELVSWETKEESSSTGKYHRENERCYTQADTFPSSLPPPALRAFSLDSRTSLMIISRLA